MIQKERAGKSFRQTHTKRAKKKPGHFVTFTKVTNIRNEEAALWRTRLSASRLVKTDANNLQDAPAFKRQINSVVEPFLTSVCARECYVLPNGGCVSRSVRAARGAKTDARRKGLPVSRLEKEFVSQDEHTLRLRNERTHHTRRETSAGSNEAALEPRASCAEETDSLCQSWTAMRHVRPRC